MSARPAAFVSAGSALHAGVVSTDSPCRVGGQDFLVILLAALGALGLDYRVASVSHNALEALAGLAAIDGVEVCEVVAEISAKNAYTHSCRDDGSPRSPTSWRST